MTKEESINNFTRAIVSLVKILSGMKDKFLAQKLQEKLNALVICYIKFSGASHNPDFATFLDIAKSKNIVQRNLYVAQYSYLDLLSSVNNVLEFLDYMEHSKAVSATPLSFARRNLLILKLELVRLNNSLRSSELKPKENKPAPEPKASVRPRAELIGSPNKEKIFNFIKRTPQARTKEIVEEFSILSERTVKRNLKELAEDGFVKKQSKDKGVHYSVA